jgi:hypothetical protein
MNEGGREGSAEGVVGEAEGVHRAVGPSRTGAPAAVLTGPSEAEESECS